MSVSISNLLDANISWLKSVGRPHWIAAWLGARCELSLNNFPEEHLYTLTWRGERLDFDDTPVGWVLPRD